MKKITLFIVLLLSLIFMNYISIAQNIDEKIKEIENEIATKEKEIVVLKNKLSELKLIKVNHDINTFGLPALTEGDTVTEHLAMSLCYSEKYEQAKWVSHIILPDIKNGGFSRTNDFRPDSLVKTGTAVKADYWNSGYDRGHLAPSADFRWNLKALSESYYYSNMSPQLPELNREIWADLENILRGYVIEKNEQLYVVTGGVLKGGLDKIGKENRVSVPETFYKVILDLEGDTLAGIGFLIPNAECENTVFSYATSIDSVELVTGIDFFAALPDSLEEVLEAENNYKQWQVLDRKDNVLPIPGNELPKNCYNSVQVKSHYDESVTVCGTIVSTHKSKAGNIFLNFDQQFPNQLFWCTIWKTNVPNYSYKPEEYLLNKKVCVKGIVKEKYGKPAMSLMNEKQIKLFEEMKKK